MVVLYIKSMDENFIILCLQNIEMEYNMANYYYIFFCHEWIFLMSNIEGGLSMLKNKSILAPGDQRKSDKIRQESFHGWWARSKLENDCDGELRRARETADNNRLL